MRKVKVRLIFEGWQEFSELIEDENIESFLTESSSCIENVTRKWQKENGCLCFNLEGAEVLEVVDD